MKAMILDGKVVGYARRNGESLSVFHMPSAKTEFDELRSPTVSSDGTRVIFGGRRNGVDVWGSMDVD